jgi:hypothetical protein
MVAPDSDPANTLPTVTLVCGWTCPVDRLGIVNGRQPGQAPDPREIEAARRWLRRCEPTSTPAFLSYRLKHLVERRCRHFVSNGAAIVAAYREGFPLRIARERFPQLNVRIAVAKASVDAAAAVDRQRCGSWGGVA